MNMSKSTRQVKTTTYPYDRFYVIRRYQDELMEESFFHAFVNTVVVDENGDMLSECYGNECWESFLELAVLFDDYAECKAVFDSLNFDDETYSEYAIDMVVRKPNADNLSSKIVRMKTMHIREV